MKQKKDSTSRLGPDRLARLFEIGGDAVLPDDPLVREQVAAEVLEDRLAGAPPLQSSTVGGLPGVLDPSWRDDALLQGRSLEEVLLDRYTPLPVIRQIKQCMKREANRHKSRPERSPEYAAALALYYAAIAGALLFHDKKITRHSYEYLAGSFGVMTKKRWLPPRLVQHLARARKLCVNKRSG